jgi:hypothetical protein
LLKLLVQHAPKLRAFVCGLHLQLHKPPWQPGLRLTDALVVSAARPTTIASLYRLSVEAPDPSHGADTLRSSPWTAEDVRAPISVTVSWPTWWPTPTSVPMGPSM